MTEPTPTTAGEPTDPMTTPLSATQPPVTPAETASKQKTAKEQAMEALYAAAGLVEVAATQVKTRLNRGQIQATSAQAKARLTEVQRQLETYRTEAGQTYVDLATRGKVTVDKTLGTAKHLSGINERKSAKSGSGAQTMPDSAPEVIVVKDGDVVEDVLVVDKDAPTQPPVV